jgi:hypothetical protein
VVCTKGWLRPCLWGHRAVLSVVPKGRSIWETPWEKRRKDARPQGVPSD